MSVATKIKYDSDLVDLKCCSSHYLQVWDAASGALLHTLGPGSEDGTAGHIKKIHAMSVNQFQPCKIFVSPI